MAVASTTMLKLNDRVVVEGLHGQPIGNDGHIEGMIRALNADGTATLKNTSSHTSAAARSWMNNVEHRPTYGANKFPVKNLRLVPDEEGAGQAQGAYGGECETCNKPERDCLRQNAKGGTYSTLSMCGDCSKWECDECTAETHAKGCPKRSRRS
jgi:hypothetical protein